jgi:hypothetical protein
MMDFNENDNENENLVGDVRGEEINKEQHNCVLLIYLI